MQGTLFLSRLNDKKESSSELTYRFKKLALGFSDDTCFHMGDVRRAKNAYSETLQTIK